MEEALGVVEKEAEHNTECKRKHNLKEGLKDNCGDGYVTGRDGARNAEGYGEKHEADCVVDSNYGKKHIGKGTLCLILLYDHKGRCGSGS